MAKSQQSEARLAAAFTRGSEPGSNYLFCRIRILETKAPHEYNGMQ